MASPRAPAPKRGVANLKHAVSTGPRGGSSGGWYRALTNAHGRAVSFRRSAS